MLLLKKIISTWLNIAKRIAAINTYILLFIVFILVITPVGLLKRIPERFSKNHSLKGSLWKKRPQAEDLGKQY